MPRKKRRFRSGTSLETQPYDGDDSKKYAAWADAQSLRLGAPYETARRKAPGLAGLPKNQNNPETILFERNVFGRFGYV